MNASVTSWPFLGLNVLFKYVNIFKDVSQITRAVMMINDEYGKVQ